MYKVPYIDSSEKISIDVHGLNKEDAKKMLERCLVNLKPQIKEVVVIHGYHSGTALQQLVRVELQSRYIKKRILSLNQGITSLIIEKPAKDW